MSEPNTLQIGMTPVGSSAPGDSSENLMRHYATVLRRRVKWIGLGVAVGLIAGIASTFLIKQAPVTIRYFKATNSLVQGGGVVPDGSTAPGYSLNQAVLLIQSQSLIEQVAAEVGLTPTQVTNQLSASIRPNVNAIDVTAIADQPEMAQQLANVGAATLQSATKKDADSSVDAQIRSLQNHLNDLVARQRQLALQSAASPDDVNYSSQLATVNSDLSDTRQQIQQLSNSKGDFTLSVLQPASAIQINQKGYNKRLNDNINARNPLVVSTNSSSDSNFNETDLSTSPGLSNTTRVALGAAAGLVLGLITAFVIEAWDDRVRRRDQVEELTQLGVLTEIPQLTREQVKGHHVAVEDESTGVAAERYRSLRTAITFAMDEQGEDATVATPILMVTSPGPAEGKTTTVSNLASAFADDGRRVLVIDGDFRRPAVRKYLLPVPNLVSPDEPCATRVDGVQFLPGPHDAPTPEIAISELDRLLNKWRSNYDLVILDTPPILTTNDAVELLPSADHVLLVLRAGRTRAKAAQRVAELLFQFSARADTLGVVLNGCDRTEMNQYYGYGYSYSYGYLGGESRRDDREPPTPPAPTRVPAPTPEPTPPAPSARRSDDGDGPATAGTDTDAAVDGAPAEPVAVGRTSTANGTDPSDHHANGDPVPSEILRDRVPAAAPAAPPRAPRTARRFWPAGGR